MKQLATHRHGDHAINLLWAAKADSSEFTHLRHHVHHNSQHIMHKNQRTLEANIVDRKLSTSNPCRFSPDNRYISTPRRETDLVQDCELMGQSELQWLEHVLSYWHVC